MEMPQFVSLPLNKRRRGTRPAGFPTVKQVKEAIEAVKWDLSISLLHGGALWGLSDTDQQYVLRKAMASNEVNYRSVLVFRRLLEIGFPMDWADVALEEALKLQDRDMVAEIFEQFLTKNADGMSLSGRLPKMTMERMLKLLAPVSWAGSYANRLAIVLECHSTGKV